MQNFTLGKKGISMLLFGLVLLIGSVPSYGQTCPTPGGTADTQPFCYLQTVGDIQTDGDAVFQTANTTSDTQPIPASEILESGIYYAGSSTGSCARIAVTVTVTSTPHPDNTLYPGSTSFSISPCLNTDFTAEDLAGFFTPLTDYEIRVYEKEFETGLASGQLTPNDSYYVGQVYTGTGSGSNCPSLRVAVGYNPANAPAPTATSPQTFCQGSTVGDLQAQGTSSNTQAIRWYRTATSFQPLTDNTLLINGQSYYATQIINDRNNPFPPCESDTRKKVDVILTAPLDLGGPYKGTICEDDVAATFPSIDEIRKYYIALIGNVVPDPGSGTLNPTATQLGAMYNADADKLGDFTTTYTYGSGACASSVDITVSIIPREDAEAGTINPIDVPCGSTDIVVLDDSILSGDATTGGTFSGTGVNSDGNFDPAIGQGSYEITYFVDDSADCVTTGTSDSTKFNIIVGGGISDLGDPISATICEDEVQALFPSEDEIRKFYIALAASAGIPNPNSGTLSPNASQLRDMYNADADKLGDFTTTYTQGSGPCAPSVKITVTIIPKEDAEAGTIAEINVPCGSTDIVVLDDSLLSDDANTGGTFSGTGVNSDGNFDPAVGPGTYEITYSVDDSADCVNTGTSDFTKFNINVSNSSTDFGDPIFATVCEDEVQTLFPSEDEIRKFYIALAASAGIPNPNSGTISPNASEIRAMYNADADGLGDFTTTYKQGSGPCASSVEITVSIIPREDANAGTIDKINVPCESSDIVVLDDTLLSDEATTGGTFSGTGVNSDGNFDPSVGPGTYEITYSVDDSADCVTTGTSASTKFDIIIGDGSDQIGTPIEPEMCITEVIKLLADPTAAIKYFNNIVADLDPALDGDFTVEPAILGAQILGYVNDPTTPSQTFSTNYTYVSTCGTVSTDISLTINNTTPADAGEIADFSLCENDEDFDLFTILTSDNPGGGTFSDASGVIEDGLFDISATDVYTITYTVSEGDLETCLSGSNSTEFKLTVTENTIVIGNAKIGILCEAEVPTIFPSVDEIRKYLINLLDPGVNKTAGTFNPAAAQLAKIYQDDADGFGDFKTKYTIVDGTCSSSVELTVRIKESLDSPIAEDTPLFCSADNVTVADIAVTGTNVMWFEDESLTISANPTDSLVDGEDYYAVSVSEDENICSSLPTSVLVSIITDASAPVAAATQDFCSTINPTVGNLVITGDNITVYEDADLTIVANNGDSLVDDEDYYATALCSSESIMITVTIGDPADAPTAAANQSFCLVNNNTVGDLEASGEDGWFASEDPEETPLPLDTVLVNDKDYFAGAGDGTCRVFTKVTVTINDADAPTLPTDENEFCRSDNPTIQDLLDNLNGSGIRIYASLTGGTAIATTTSLEDGVQYFATATNSTAGCESSERLAIRVEVAFCGIPEGFSPNGDGKNDTFEIPDIAIDYPNYTIEIYNRWGNMVFKGNASTPDWDGISNKSGTLGDGVLPVGVYFYILNYNDGATASEQGKLYLSR